MAELRLRHLDSATAISAEAWDRLFPADYPFTRHAFLSALEIHGCASRESGWTPCHAVLQDASGTAVAAAPLYLKAHSYGEFVFDFSWAEASRSIGKRYYPKLLSAVPFTPATGPRFGARDGVARLALAQALPGVARNGKLSSFHALFLGDEDFAALDGSGCVERNDVQFHWHNKLDDSGAGYADFSAFVAGFSSDKRKKLLRERRRVAEAGLRFEVRAGDELDTAAWERVYALYANTYEERGQDPYLSLEFFLDYGRADGTPVRLILAYDGERLVAVAITVQGGDTLYGRHWGADARYHSLHFETCYYQGIEYCIREGLKTFDAGAQGEHKLARGFDPVRTRSAHWLADPRLHQAVDRAMSEERQWVGLRGEALGEHRPYKQAVEGAAEPVAEATRGPLAEASENGLPAEAGKNG
jgi:predicted N-acyltransferase